MKPSQRLVIFAENRVLFVPNEDTHVDSASQERALIRNSGLQKIKVIKNKLRNKCQGPYLLYHLFRPRLLFTIPLNFEFLVMFPEQTLH